MREIFKQLHILLSAGQRKQFALLLGAKFLSVLLECLGISLIFPIISVIVNPEFIQTTMLGGWLGALLHTQDPRRFLLCALIAIVVLYILKNAYILAIKGWEISYTRTLQFALKKRLLFGFFYAPYSKYMDYSTPDLIQMVELDADGSVALVEKLLQIGSELLMMGLLGTLLLLVNPGIAMVVILLYAGLLLLFARFIKPYFESKSKEFVKTRHDFSKWLHQTISNIKEIKAEQKEYFFIRNFDRFAQATCKIDTKTQFIQSVPRALFEICSVVCILIVVLLLVASGAAMEQVVSQLSLFGVVALRLMPSALRFNQVLNGIFWNTPLLSRTVKRLEQLDEWDVQEQSALPYAFTKNVELERISFRYPNTQQDIFTGASMEIAAGEIVGVCGLSGSGKTTLVDIMMGLLPISQGEIRVDGRNISDDPGAMASWRAGVAYLPQNTCLLNGTIRENILFGSEDLGDEALWDVLEQAVLGEFVRQLPKGLETPVGEGGSHLSGGQRQRLAFARALYKKAQFLVLDETTSALDVETEEAVLQVLQRLKGRCTIVLISHRPSAMECCDRVYTVADGKICKR